MNIYSQSEINQTLSSKKYFLSKSRGQNYLINKHLAYTIVERIYSKLDFQSSLNVIEVGSGLGALTLPLLEKFSKVISIEIDKGIFQLLLEVINQHGFSDKFEGINSDFLKLHPSEVLNKVSSNYIFVSNLPYNVGGEILKKMYYEYDTKHIFVMVQKEFFERLIAKPGQKNYSSLSVVFQLNNEIIEELVYLKNTNFFPIPSIDSVFVFMKKKNTLIPQTIIKKMQKLFSTRRKNILNSIILSTDISKEKGTEILEELKINKNTRIEDLTPNEILNLALNLENKLNSNEQKA
ncbi:MAG: 16S rRNA (adenine(1518)-N(6)/adenine(1519)-N(6))-dimethyltransferase RsmA [Brevinematia bacterium]